jgi:heat shock protein HspQ
MVGRLPSPSSPLDGGFIRRLACFASAAAYIRDMDKLSIDRATYFSPQAGRVIEAPQSSSARFAIGDIVRHKLYDFRGVIFDIDPVFANSEEWYESIPKEVRPAREQPYYHLLAENEESNYIAYVSQQNLLQDAEGGPVEHPNVAQLFEDFANGRYRLRRGLTH